MPAVVSTLSPFLPRTRTWVIAGLLIMVGPAMLWAIGTWVRDRELSELREDAGARQNVYATGLRNDVSKFESLPVVIGKDPRIRGFLAHPADSELQSEVNSYLETVISDTGASDLYLMDNRGLTIASSNWNLNHSFVGRNFSFRPYFQEAAAGEKGRYFALGTTSDKRGYYFSAPVAADDGISGVVVVKVGVEELEAAWAAGRDRIFVTDPDGVVFLASEPGWNFRSLGPLPGEARDRIRASRKYGNVEIGLLPLRMVRSLDGGAHLVRMNTAEAGDPDPTSFLMQSREMGEIGWTIHMLVDTSPVARRVTATVAAAALVMLVLVLLGLFLMQRRAHARERFEMQARVKEQLETLVKERTADLVQVNQELKREVAERTDTERTLRETQAGLVQAGKLAALGQIAAELAHELNQPLTAIRSYADNANVYLRNDRPSEAAENLSTIGELTERMAKITKQLKTFARKSTGMRAELSVTALLRDVVALFEPICRKAGAELFVTEPSEDITIFGDAIQLEQVLVNLTQNALDAMVESGRKTLRIEADTSKGRVCIRVRDSGAGIDEGALPKLFEPYFTTKDIGQGLGLGLSISFGIVKEHGGSIRAANCPGGGAEFTVTLPSARALSGATT